MKKNDIKNSADLFLYKAIVDFNSASALYKLFMSDEIEIDIEKVFFDLQQSVEKLLKSILAKNCVEVLKTHDIYQLIKHCKDNNIQLYDNIELLIDLNDYAVEGRYDIICDDIEDAKEYFAEVEKLIKHVKEHSLKERK